MSRKEVNILMGFSRESKGRIERFERQRQDRVIKEREHDMEWVEMLGCSGQRRQASYTVERV